MKNKDWELSFGFYPCILLGFRTYNEVNKSNSPGIGILKTWQNSLSNGQPVHAFSDMSLSPISIDEVVQKIDFLVKEKATGVFQLSGEKDISYFEFSQEFAIENGYSPVLVKKDSWGGKLELAPPKFTSMLNV